MPEQWQQVARRVLVGRGRELAALEEAWAAAEAGARQLVLVGGDAGAGKSRLAAEVATALHRAGATVLARNAPIVLILEDLHWTGAGGQQLLTYVVRQTAACRLLILATYRNAPPDRSGALVETIVALQGIDGVRRLDLPPLRSEDIAEFLVREAGMPAGRAGQVAATLHEQIGGNPYFVGELWRDLLARGGLPALRDPVATPASVRQLITGAEDPGGFWAPGLLALYTEFGMRGSAARVMRWILDNAVLCDEASAQWPMVLAFLAEAALTLQDRATAARLRPPLERYTGLNLVAEPFVALFGSADRYIGAFDSLLGQGDPEASLAAALDMDTRMAAPVHVAHTLAAAAAHHRRIGAGDTRARELARQAREIAEPLRLRRVLRTLGRPATASRPAGLTDREVEVLVLISAGLGNREIGRRLFITENTAANHVRNILTKTGTGNRTQAARYATDHGLLP